MGVKYVPTLSTVTFRLEETLRYFLQQGSVPESFVVRLNGAEAQLLVDFIKGHHHAALAAAVKALCTSAVLANSGKDREKDADGWALIESIQRGDTPL